jgi:NADH-quinone oxidoreductase subunit G
MPQTVKITIDDVQYEVPAGANLVDALKHQGIDVPVFCYHPKLGHDGNCRMCLVELATPRKNPQSGEMELAWFPTLQTACTQRTSEGMTIRTLSEKVTDGRKEILEFLLSSHPLDCPICDKGGECPLQNLTMRHGPGTSRMYWEEKMHLGKHVPLGELIFLDQERCIHCARCIRFSDIIAEDHVLGFDERGRHQQIITMSDPGFDSIFSGNTTDICPVGALTTADFRFNARPWEMNQVGTICSHCPVGCNMNFDTRTSSETEGHATIKRVMPRQNEAVNEIWICDKGRFGHHYMEHAERLTTPLVRRGGRLVEASWEDALNMIAAEIKSAGSNIAGIAGGRLSNEDLYVFQKLIRSQGSHNITSLPEHAPSGEFAAQAGVGMGTNLLDMGKGDAIVVVASDLHEEAPVWWLRVIAAAKRGASLIVINGRGTRLDAVAAHSIRTTYGDEVSVLNGLLASIKPAKDVKLAGLDDALKAAKAAQADKNIKAAAQAISDAANVVMFVGSEGLDSVGADGLAQAAVNVLAASGHVGRANNGLIIVWPSANGQGASDMGVRPDRLPGYQKVDQPGMGYNEILKALEANKIKVIYIAGVDPAFSDPQAAQALNNTKGLVIVQDLFLTETANLADVVLPAQSIAEREGTYTSGERRVQRFYAAVEPAGDSLPDWLITQAIGEKLGQGAVSIAPSIILAEIAASVPQYGGVNYQKLAEVAPQFPDVGGEDLYYGGTSFQNHYGLGLQLASMAEQNPTGLALRPARAGKPIKAKDSEFIAVPVTVIYDTEAMLVKTELLQGRIPVPHAMINPADARKLSIANGEMIDLKIGGHSIHLAAYLDENVPKGIAAIPRNLQEYGAPQFAAPAAITRLEKVRA